MALDNTALSEFIRHLSDGEYHSIFSLHERYRLSPSRIIECIEYLNNKNVLEINGDKIKLKPILDNTTLAEIRKAFCDRQLVIEGSSDARYSEPAIKINQLYMPNVDILDASLNVSLKN
jgi:hypothetical protein